MIIYNDIDINDDNSPVGILFSGGTDSSLLLYFLLKYFKVPIHVFTVAKNETYRVAATTTSKVIERCIQLTGNTNITHVTSYGTANDLEKLPVLYFKLGLIKSLYFGITANPPKYIGDSFINPESNSQHTERDPEILHDVISSLPTDIGPLKIIQPFSNINKQDIYEIYKKYNLLDTLFEHTRSCELLGVKDFYDHCGICWWCKEREWGFVK